MCSESIAIHVDGIGKQYQIYDHPRDRLKQFILPRLKRLVGRPGGQYFREFWALRSISFAVKKGEAVGIIGRNGSGKSTLLQIICNTHFPTTGEVRTSGRIAALLELGSGFNPEFTGRENIYMNAAILGLSQDEIDARFDSIAAFADIGEFIEQPVKSYSSGMVVRLAFAVAINVDPEILIVDEALSVGDELFQRKCFSRIDAIRNQGATILFVSHSAAQIVELCDRAVLMESGEMLTMGEPKHVVASYQKLIYAPLDQQKAICQSIRTSISGESAPQESIVIPGASHQAPGTNDELAEFYDPNLKPKTTMFYESHGAHICLPDIFTLTGEKVNNLRRGKSYDYVYKVDFDKDARDVRFGMMIKAINGTEIGGIGSASLGSGVEHIKAGSTVNVRITFQCHLLPGNYFINAGCSGKTTDEDTFLHRIVDAVAFRVLPKDSLENRAGYIDFAAEGSFCSIEIEE